MPPILPPHPRHSSRRVRREITHKYTRAGAVVGIVFLLFLGAIAFAMQQALTRSGMHPPEAFLLVWNLITGFYMVVAFCGIVSLTLFLITGKQSPGQIIEVNDVAVTEQDAEGDTAARLKNLDDLLRQELVSQDEYQSKRAEILAGV